MPKEAHPLSIDGAFQYLGSNAKRKETLSTLKGKERERSVQQGSLGDLILHLLAALPQLFTAFRAVCGSGGSPVPCIFVTWVALEEA